MLHDLYAYKSGSYDDHAHKGAELARTILEELQLTNEEETDIICTVSDALVLQYYEEKDLRKAAFNHSLTFDEWKAIGQVKDVYGDVLFSAPLVSVNVAHPLLIEIDTHKFTEKGISHYQIRCDCKACGHVWFINAG